MALRSHRPPGAGGMGGSTAPATRGWAVNVAIKVLPRARFGRGRPRDSKRGAGRGALNPDICPRLRRWEGTSSTHTWSRTHRRRTRPCGLRHAARHSQGPRVGSQIAERLAAAHDRGSGTGKSSRKTVLNRDAVQILDSGWPSDPTRTPSRNGPRAGRDAGVRPGLGARCSARRYMSPSRSAARMQITVDMYPRRRAVREAAEARLPPRDTNGDD